MKKLTLMVVALASLSTLGFGQKQKVTLAENSILLQKFDDAKTNIEEAIANEKTATWPKTYLVAADLYGKMAAAGKDDAGIDKAKEYILKAIEFDAVTDAKGKGAFKFKKDITKQLEQLATQSINAGVKGFDIKNYNMAKKAFITATWANKERLGDQYNMVLDSTLVYNAAIAAMQESDWETAIEYFGKCVEVEYDGPLSVRRITYSLAQLKDTARMEENLKKGFQKYPEDKDILTELIQFYLNAHRNEDALVYLNEAIAKDPSNPQFYFARGCLNEKIDINAAISDYTTAIEKNPSFYNALYNLGVVHYNLGVQYFGESNDLGNTRERDAAKKKAILAESDAKKQQANDEFKAAIEPMKKAADSTDNSEDKKNALDIVKRLYYQLGMYDESQAVADQIKAIQ